MSSLNDLPLQDERGDDALVAPSAPSSPGPRAIVIGVLVSGVIGAGLWLYVKRAPAGAPPQAASASAPAAPAAAAPGAAAVVLPPLAEMDPFVRTLFTTLGTHPELLKWLATDDLVGSIATAIDRLAQGQSPARDLAVLRPAQGFAVARGGDRIDPASYARYTPLAQAVAAIDPQALAQAFATLRPRIAEAYVKQGHPEGSLDEAVRRAIAVVTSTPDIPTDARLVRGVGGYAYADPALERLPAAQRHLLRMGPDTVRVVRDAATRFGTALAALSATR